MDFVALRNEDVSFGWHDAGSVARHGVEFSRELNITKTVKQYEALT